MNVAALWAILGLWLAWGVYWLLSARDMKRTIRHESPASRAAHLVPLAVAALLLAVPSMPGWLGSGWPGAGPGRVPTGVVLVALGLAFSVWARAVLGRNWSATVTLKEGHEFVRSGPYRLVRHPIYTGLLLAFAGSAVARGEWRGLLAIALVAAAFWRKLRLEERWMTEEFGARYADYCKQTRALIPFIL